MTVLYTTHYMEEAQELSDHIGIMDNGELIAQGTNAELVKKPEAVNSDPYGQGWMIVVKLTNLKELDALLSATDYEQLVAGAGH